MSRLINMRGNPGGDQYDGLDSLALKVNRMIGDNLVIVEIGSYQGESTDIISKNFPNSTIHAVDMWTKYIESVGPEGEDNFFTTFDGDITKLPYSLESQDLELKEAEAVFDKLIENRNIIKNKMSSIEFSKKIEDNSVDFVYIDGNHQCSAVKADILSWIPKIKNNGIISGHDFTWVSIRRALNECFDREPDELFRDGSWYYIVRK